MGGGYNFEVGGIKPTSKTIGMLMQTKEVQLREQKLLERKSNWGLQKFHINC